MKVLRSALLSPSRKTGDSVFQSVPHRARLSWEIQAENWRFCDPATGQNEPNCLVVNRPPWFSRVSEPSAPPNMEQNDIL